jgi:hypothetical protein
VWSLTRFDAVFADGQLTLQGEDFGGHYCLGLQQQQDETPEVAQHQAQARALPQFLKMSLRAFIAERERKSCDVRVMELFGGTGFFQ